MRGKVVWFLATQRALKLEMQQLGGDNNVARVQELDKLANNQKFSC